MARKPAAKKKPTQPVDVLADAERRGDHTSAVAAARRLYADDPATLARLRDTVYRAGLAFADTNDAAQLDDVLTTAAKLGTDDPAWRERMACILARAGRPGPDLSPTAAGHFADYRVRTRSPEAADVLAVFDAYERGDDTIARERLNGIGLTSPFLDWKLLLRGLLAYTAGDDARAVENWRRLVPDRLPAKLAAPLWYRIDPAFTATVYTESIERLTSSASALLDDRLVLDLHSLRNEIGRDNHSLKKSWEIAGRIVPALRTAAPHLLPRLARCLYHAISKQGEPADLPKYAKLFGDPAFDPQFERLQAVAYEDSGALGHANTKWAKVESWLAGRPPGWPAAVADRARAIILHRLGQNAGRAADRRANSRDDLLAAFDSLFDERRKASLNGPPAEEYFRRAMALAPGWSAPAEALFNRCIDAGRTGEAETIARNVLAADPHHLWALEALAVLASTGHRFSESLALWLRALDANPLDRRLRAMTAHATFAAARDRLKESAADAAGLMESGRAVCADAFPIGYHALFAVILHKLRRTEEAEQERFAANARPGARLAVAYTTVIDSGLAKIKPADRKVADIAFKDALLADPDPLEVSLLYAAWDAYAVAGIKYRGHKTHEKTILDLCPRTLASAGKAFDFENLVLGLVAREQWKVAEKITAPLERRFPTSATLKVCLAELLSGKRGYASEMRVERLLDEASAILDAATEPDPRAEQLRSRIAAMRGRFDSAAALLDFFTDRRR